MSLRWLPNAISLLRIGLVVPVVYLIVGGRHDLALILYFVAGASDALDGYLAKSFGWRTRAGELLDPIADKLLVSASFAALWFAGLLPLWLAVLVILRDVVIISGATLYHFLIRPVPGLPTNVSKLNTALEFTLVLATLSRSAYAWPGEAAITTLGAAVFVTVVISGVDYVWSWSIRAREGR